MPIDNVQNERNDQARRVALATITDLAIESTTLVQFASRGHVLVIGDMDAMDIAHRMTEPLHAKVLLTDGAEEPGVPVVHQARRSVRIEGYLGAFQVHLGEEGKPTTEVIRADLLLDLSPSPLMAMPVPPLGYVHSSIDEDEVSQAIETLSEMVGTFEKPKYFEYDAGKCAHGRNGKTACTQCIDACPTEAITSLVDSVQVDSNLCQGGGVCATVCPSGAIRYTYPGPKDTLVQIRTLLRSYQEQGGEQPVLAFFAESDGELPQVMAGNVLPVMLEELASVGLEIWLSSLAYGATAVLLVDGGSMPASVRAAVDTQLQTAGEILATMGYPADAISLIARDELAAPLKGLMSLPKTAGYTTQNDKRETAYMAIDHLFAQAEHPKPMAMLSTGAPFGFAEVDAQRCTLCMSCVSACPGNALRSGQETPELKFVEANCLQCGMCTSTCPEDAISISPRLLLKREARNELRILHEEQPFHCVVCSKPFATESVITNMLAKLQGHAMFQTERARRRLMMCEDCRVVDVTQDPEAMEGGLSLNEKPNGQFHQ